MILIRYLVFEIVVIKGDAREKNENKNKTLKGQGNLKMAMCSKSPRGAYQYFNFSSQHKWAVLLFNFHTLYEFRFSDWLICTT